MQWNIIGHTEQKAEFERCIRDNAFAHAYALHGPDGIGKKLLALECAHAIAGVPDIRVLEPGISDESQKITAIAVEDVRRVREWAYQRPLYGAHKVVVIDHAELMSADAANTILKVLEEPPAFVVFFFITALPSQVLPTIASRCMHIAFHGLAPDELDVIISRTPLTPADAALVRAISDGRPGVVVQMSNTEVRNQIAASIDAFSKTLSGGITERLLLAKEVAGSDNAREQALWWLAWIHMRLERSPSLAPVASGLLDVCVVLQGSKYNTRLALESFLCGLPTIHSKAKA